MFVTGGACLSGPCGSTSAAPGGGVFVSRCEPCLREEVLNLDQFKVEDSGEQTMGERHDPVPVV